MKLLHSAQQQSGFSLIEMAVVLVVLGLALGGLLMPLSVQLENSARKETTAEMHVIKEAIIGFSMANNRLPCPDTDGDGRENQTVSGSDMVCTRTYGELPHGSLGVGIDDAWHHEYSYLVTDEFADTVAGTSCGTPPSSGASFSLCSRGDLTVQDRAGNTVADELPVIIVSHGKNNLVPARNAFERSNFDTSKDAAQGSNTTKIKDSYSDSSGNELDDLVEWVSPALLQNKMVSAGRIP